MRIVFLKVLTIINAPHAPKNKIASLVDEQKVTKTKGFCRNGFRNDDSMAGFLISTYNGWNRAQIQFAAIL